ncbi:MAG: FAD-dependent oxidoreductase, partial [Desulfoprunum sp.]|uniref:phytoene desaturase family protein n=1 Tax=Desulfoprunum sp. TaxID=2020866 RepID=UPI003C75CCFF
FARFNPEVLILEKHTRIGGLNSYFYRNNRIFETGLHAITNYAEAGDRKAPLNRLLRQLKFSRDHLDIHQQICSEIVFRGAERLLFSNDFQLIKEQIATKFPHSSDGFGRLVTLLDSFDPFRIAPFRSARQFLADILPDRLLVDMLLCPLMFYGSSIEDDMDLSQFAIMFRSIFQEGMFRPGETIKILLDRLLDHYRNLGGSIRTGAEVREILHDGRKVHGVVLTSGETIDCGVVLSTIGLDETLALLHRPPLSGDTIRLGFVETIYQLQASRCPALPADRTIIFFNNADSFHYRRPDQPVDFSSGVICLPMNFAGLGATSKEVRSTHLASYDQWQARAADRRAYASLKVQTAERSRMVLEDIVGDFGQAIVFQDTFTPLTIERYTAKKEGAIYGNPQKIKDGDLGYDNLFLAGTDQGFLGIVGSMLSGVSMVNQHILNKF